MAHISVLIPAYNAGPYLAQTLDSVLAQTFTDWECIIVDDASTDDTAQVAQRYVERDSRFKLHRVDPADKKPHPASRNIALSLATGKWISPLDADDWWEPWKLQRQLAAVEADPKFVLCCCATWVWHQGKVTSRSPNIDQHNPGRALLITCITANSVLANRQAVIEAGGYDPDMLLAEDWDLWTRLIMQNGMDSVTGFDEPSMFYRRHDSNITSDTWRNIKYDRKLVHKLLWRGGLWRKHPLIALRLLDAQVVREMDLHMRSGRWLHARWKSLQVIALNPLRSWRWHHAGRAWKRHAKPASQNVQANAK